MEQSNSGMQGHGMPATTNTTKKQTNKKTNFKTNDATRFKQSDVDELFNLVKTKDGIIICLGKFKVSSKTFKTFKEADIYIAGRPYEILVNVTCLIVKLNIQDEKEQNSTESAKNN